MHRLSMNRVSSYGMRFADLSEYGYGVPSPSTDSRAKEMCLASRFYGRLPHPMLNRIKVCTSIM
jgi:hypothetical protein